MPKMIDLHRRLEGQGLVLLGIHTKNRGEQMAAYAEEVGIPFPIAVDVDGQTVDAFAVDSYPDYYLIDRAGKLRVADLANGDLERAVGILLAEPVPEGVEPPQGEGPPKGEHEGGEKPPKPGAGTEKTEKQEKKEKQGKEGGGSR